MRLRALLLVLGGLPVSGAILGSFTTLAALSVVHGPPLPQRDWLQGAVFVVLAFAVVGMAIRTFLRVRREGAGAGSAGPEFLLLAKGAPVLVAIGFGLGVWWGMGIASGRLESDHRARDELCAAPAVLGLDAATCRERLPECRTTAWREPIHDHNDPEVTKLHVAVSQRMEKIDDPVARRPYLEILEELTSSFTVADFNRRTLVCLVAPGS